MAGQTKIWSECWFPKKEHHTILKINNLENRFLDTNVLLVSVSRKSRFYNIFDAFINGKFKLCVTNEILFEYEEILKKYFDASVAEIIMEIIENAENVVWINKFYKWNLISADADDNKFVDCAIASGAKFLISNDRHFNVLQNIEFPKVDVIKADDFLKII